MFCRKCGDKLPEDSLFCPKCGERVLAFPVIQGTVSPASKPEFVQRETFYYKKYFASLFNFSSTISRKYFMWNLLIILAVQSALWFIYSAADGGLFSILALIAISFTLIPLLALTVQRVRDAGCTLFLIPAFIILLLYLITNTVQYSQKMTETYRLAEIAQNQKIKTSSPPRKGFDLEGYMRDVDQRERARRAANRLRKEADSYSRHCYNYRISAIMLPIIFYGVFFLLPSRKR